MKKVTTMMATMMATMMIAGVAMAQGHVGSVTDYIVHGDLAFFEVDPSRTDVPACAGTHSGFVVDPDSHLGQVIYDYFKNGEVVEVWGSGGCNIWSNWENVVRIEL